jgi:hypothetical protein
MMRITMDDPMSRSLALVALAFALSGCESTSRFDGFGSAPGPSAAVQPLEPAIAAPTAPVTTQPLPPVAGTAPAAGAPAAGPDVVASAPTMAPAPPPPTTRGLVGAWRISDAARGNCAISLTQTALLDLYRASPSGCQAGSLAKVNAWQQRGQEIVLLEPGGRTAVRLFPKGDGTYEGAATTSGAIIRMSR